MAMCRTCKFWGDDEGGRADCRRYPPQINPNAGPWCDWPQTDAEDWCGEHKPEEIAD